MTKGTLSRRTFLQGIGATGSVIRMALPPLTAMFNPHGTAYGAEREIPSRFVLWFNGNGIPEQFWIPLETGPHFEMTPCLAPLAPLRRHIHVISGLDNPNGRVSGTGNEHMRSMSGIVSGERFTGSGAGGASIDQYIAGKIGAESRFSSIQIGVCQESFGHSIQRNLSWAGRDRPLPPEMVPHKLFDRLFGARDYGWVKRKKSILDAVYKDTARIEAQVGAEDKQRIEEYLSSVRDTERAIVQLPQEYRKIDAPDVDTDPKNWPAVSKIQCDLLAHAFASGQTRVASYMLTKCQSLTRLPWLGLGSSRHHDYTHTRRGTLEHQEIMRDICRWHVEEFAYLLNKLNSIPEGNATLLDRTCLLFVHEHAEADDHKNRGLAVIVAGHANKMTTGRHTRTVGTLGDLYLTLANDVMGAGIEKFPTALRHVPGIVH